MENLLDLLDNIFQMFQEWFTGHDFINALKDTIIDLLTPLLRLINNDNIINLDIVNTLSTICTILILIFCLKIVFKAIKEIINVVFILTNEKKRRY